MVYSKIFLAFLSALMRNDQNTDAYLFHTELVRVTDALKDENTGAINGKAISSCERFWWWLKDRL